MQRKHSINSEICINPVFHKLRKEIKKNPEVESIKEEIDFINKDVDNYDKGKTLVSNGVWMVPIEQRPKGWEKLGVKEKCRTD